MANSSAARHADAHHIAEGLNKVGDGFQNDKAHLRDLSAVRHELQEASREMSKKTPAERQAFYKSLVNQTTGDGAHLPGVILEGHEDEGNIKVGVVDGGKTKILYDQDKEASKTPADQPASTTRSEPTANGMRESTSRSDGSSTILERDSLGNVEKQRDVQSDKSYNQLTKKIDGFETEHGDGKGSFQRHTVVNSPDGSTVTDVEHEHKKNGDFIERTSENGKLQSTKLHTKNHDGGWSEQIVKPDGSSTVQKYDASGNEISAPAPAQSDKSPEDATADGRELRQHGSSVKVIGKAASLWSKTAPIGTALGNLGGSMGALGRAGQVLSSLATGGVEEARKEAEAIGAGVAAGYAAGAIVGLALPEGGPIPVYGARALAGSIAETCTRDASHGKNCLERPVEASAKTDIERAQRDWELGYTSTMMSGSGPKFF